jgi:hypothetical protein
MYQTGFSRLRVTQNYYFGLWPIFNLLKESGKRVREGGFDVSKVHSVLTSFLSKRLTGE